MTRYRALVVLALSVSVCAASAGAAAPVPANTKAKLKANNLNVNRANHNGHAHHLQNALKDLEKAEAAISAQNLKLAHKDVAAAIRQIEEAIAHHHKHHVAQPTNSGLTGTFNRARHHQHHNTLKQAVAELRVAEKDLHNGNGTGALKEINKAEKTIQQAIASHHHLFGQQQLK